MDFYKIGLEVKLTELEDKFIKVQDYVRNDRDAEGIAKYDEAMDLLRAIIEEVKKWLNL